MKIQDLKWLTMITERPALEWPVLAGLKNGASGTAPEANLMPIRLRSGLGSMSEAKAFVWAADHGADVISCSWGPADGDWWKAEDPIHKHTTVLPDSTRLAIKYALTKGRKGLGCVIPFAAGNGNEDIANDGYCSNEGVIAVSACNDSGKRSVYSDFGKAIWVSFPSNDFEYEPFKHPAPGKPGIAHHRPFGEAGICWWRLYQFIWRNFRCLSGHGRNSWPDSFGQSPFKPEKSEATHPTFLYAD